jgi:hypothetical protein
MTPHRKANQNSHFAIFPALRRDVPVCARRLNGHSVSTRRHSANGIVACVGPQLDHGCGAANAAHRVPLCRDETSRYDVHSGRRDCEFEFVAESIVFHRSVASWCVSQDGVSPRCPVPVAERREPKTGPEMGLKKLSSATSQGSPCPAAPNNSSSIAPVVGGRLRSAGYPGGAVRQGMPSAQWSQISSYGSGSDRAPHCADVLQVQSTVLRWVGGASWAANQQHGGGAGQNVLGKKTSLSLFSVVASSLLLAGSSPAIGLLSRSPGKAVSARREMPISSSPGSRSRTRKLCMLSTARYSQNECRSESNQRQDRSAGWPKAPVRPRSVQ